MALQVARSCVAGAQQSSEKVKLHSPPPHLWQLLAQLWSGGLNHYRQPDWTASLMAKTGLAFAVDLGSGGCDEAPAQALGKNFAIRLSRLFCWLVVCLCAALITAPQVARAQCAVPPNSNGGVVQNGGAPCTVGAITVGFGTAITATNSADVTANGAVTAHGFGTGISAATNSIVTVNGPVTASGLGLGAASGSTIIANNIVLSNDGGGGAIAMSANNATITANGVTVNWSSGGGQSLVQALAGGLIQFTAPSTINNANGGVPSILLASGTGSRIIADGLSVSTGGSGGITAARAEGGGNIQLRGGAITFSGGGGNTGLLATGANSAITATGVSITVGTGGNDVGAKALDRGVITLNGGSVAMPGDGGGEIGSAGKRRGQHAHGDQRDGDCSDQQQRSGRSGCILRRDGAARGQRQHRRRVGYRTTGYRKRQLHSR